MDTNASVRALPPSSLFGGSRESLPLSILSATEQPSSNASAFNVGGRPSLVGHASTERASIYSIPASIATHGGDHRTSFNASSKQQGLDGSSIKSGQQSTHVRNDSQADVSSVKPMSNADKAN